MNADTATLEHPNKTNTGFQTEILRVVEAAKSGQLDVRANTNNFQGADNELMQSINEMIDAFVAPINVTAEYVDRISKGDIPPRITDTYQGDFNEIKNNLNACIDVMSGLLEETGGLIKATQEGKLDTRGDATKFAGGWGELIGGVNNLIDAFVAPINVTAEYVDRISKGDIPPRITDTYQGDFNEIKNNLNACIDVMSGLLEETNGLIKATQEGKLDTRGDATKFAGEWGELIGGVNKLIDAFVGPFNISAEYVDRISKGDIPPKITEAYQGDFNEVKNNLNACIDVMSGLLEETDGLIQATQEGKLDTRGDASKFAGGWGELVGGVNKLIEAFVDPINITSEYVDSISKGDIPPKITATYLGDFGVIKVNLNNCIDVMNGLLEETDGLVKATQEGKLDTRGDASKFAGGWGELVGGVNNLIDAFVGPFNVTAEYVDRISKGDIPPRITDTYKGDFNEIKNNLNGCIDVMNGLLEETNGLIDAARAGKLDKRGDTAKFGGGWSELVQGVNALIDILSDVLLQIASNTTEIDAGAQQISQASQSLAEGASEQASSIEQISASLEEVSSMTAQNADNAKQASVLAEESQKSAALGQTQMADMNVATEEIKQSSAEIGKIIKVIDEIAFQTNLLALNAAVEAARAGEAGKGFAVVADEVRNLAQRSAEAAKNTATMIEESTKRADNGVTIAGKVSDALNEIAGSTQKVNTLLDEVASASGEQSEGVGEITKGVGEMDKVTQQNAGNAEELASAAEETASQVASLRELVSRFTFQNGAGSTPTSRPAAAKPSRRPTTSSRPAAKPASKPTQPTPEESFPLDDDDFTSF